MLWEINPASKQPLQAQIAGTIRRGVAEGGLAPGERLPPAAELGAALGVHANTVLSAYRQLRDEGVLEFRRGRGVRVRAGSVTRAAVDDAARRLIELGHENGYSERDLAALILAIGGGAA